MIWFFPDDTVTSVDLLQQDYPHKLMGKCHFGKAQCKIRLFQDFFPQSDRAADNEYDMACSLDSELINFICELFRRKLFSIDLQCDHICVFTHIPQDTFRLFCPYHLFFCGTRIIDRFFICNLDDLQFAVP